MKAPKKLYEGKYRYTRQWELPDREWLVDQYHTQDQSADQIAAVVGCRQNHVLRWLGRLSISTKSKAAQGERHARLMSGPGNPAWVDGYYAELGSGGRSRVCQRALRRSGVLEVCCWCGVSVEDERLEAHHKDHNPKNSVLANLQWLCVTCHRFESYLWRLWKQDKLDLQCEGRTMVINFK